MQDAEQFFSDLNRDDLNILFEDYFHEYYLPLKRFALKYIKDDVLAEDAVQEVFLRFWVKMSSLDNSYSLKDYLYKSVKNQVLNLLKTKAYQILKITEELNDRSRSNHFTEDVIYFNEYSSILEKGINLLPPQRKLIFVLKSYQGLSSPEIALKCNISVNTVKFQVSQATKFLKSFLKKEAGINPF